MDTMNSRNKAGEKIGRFTILPDEKGKHNE